MQRLNVGDTLTMCGTAYALAMRSAGTGTIINVTVSPHHGMPAMAHTGAARAAVEASTIELVRKWVDDGVSVVAVALGRLATESLRKYLAELRREAAKTVPLQRLGEAEEYGRLVARSPRHSAALSGSVVTLDGALDNWTGPWPPDGLARDGEVPTEEPAARLRLDAALVLAGLRYDLDHARGRSVVVAQKPSKLLGRVRFPSPAPLTL